MLFLKVVILQAFWFFAVLIGPKENEYASLLLAIFLVIVNYFVFKPNLPLRRYLCLAFVFSLYGVAQDNMLINFGIIELDHYPLWLLSMWVVFIAYYDDIFSKFKSLSFLPLFLIGGCGGAASYYSGFKLDAITVSSENLSLFLILVGISWGVFFPMSLRIFFKNGFWESFLDKTALYSFDKTGFKRHSKKFKENLEDLSLQGKTVLVTGGTSGIGMSAVESFVKMKAKVLTTGRNQKKGNEFCSQTDGASFEVLDMSDWNALKAFADHSQVFDHLVFNAGGMPDKLVKNKYGVESQAASQLFGHFYLLKFLHEAGKIAKGARIVWVSSGGMYLKKLAVAELIGMKDYDKVSTYANVKRAQVTLVEELVKSSSFSNYASFAMHPGWVSTDAVKEALPRFNKFMDKRLRSLKEGADTIVWLVASARQNEKGAFYFDRKRVSPYITGHFNPSEQERKKLLDLLDLYFSKID